MTFAGRKDQTTNCSIKHSHILQELYLLITTAGCRLHTGSLGLGPVATDVPFDTESISLPKLKPSSSLETPSCVTLHHVSYTAESKYVSGAHLKSSFILIICTAEMH